MKRIISILLLTYPILVFADTLQFKNGIELEGSIIIIGKDYLVFKVSEPNFVINSFLKNSVKEVLDNQTIVFKLDYISIPEDFWGMGPAELLTQNEDESDEDFQTRVEEDAIARIEPIQNRYLLDYMKKPKPSLVDETFSVHSGLGSSRGIGLFGFSKDLLFTDNIGVYFSAGIGTPVSSTHMTFGVGTFFQSHYNDNGWNIAALFGMAEIGGQNLTGLIYYQYRIGKRGLVSIGLLQGAFLRSRPASYWRKYIKDPNFPSGRYKYTFPIISYDFLFL